MSDPIEEHREELEKLAECDDLPVQKYAKALLEDA